MNDKLLSQSDIDSLVSGLAGKEQAVPKKETAAPASIAPGVTSQPPEGAAAIPMVKEVSMQDAVPKRQSQLSASSPELSSSLNAKLVERLSRVEAKVQKLEQYERVKSGIGPAPVSSQQFQELAKYVQKLSEEVRSISVKLQSTLGYDIYHSFKCERCGTQEQVATVFKCTSCGHESWRGWWPKNR